MLASRIASFFRFAGLLGMILMVGSFAVLILVAMFVPGMDRKDLPWDEAKIFTVRGDAESVGGMSRVAVVRGEIRRRDGSVEPVTVRSLEDDSWGDEIDTRVTTYRGAQVSDGVSAPKLRLEVSLTGDQERWQSDLGQDVDLHLSGEYEYPKVSGASVFDIEVERFASIEAVRLTGPGVARNAKDWAMMAPTLMVSWGFLMTLVGWPVAFIAWKIADRTTAKNPMIPQGVPS